MINIFLHSNHPFSIQRPLISPVPDENQITNIEYKIYIYYSLFQAQSDDDDVADEVSVPVGGPDDFMTEFFADVSIT